MRDEATGGEEKNDRGDEKKFEYPPQAEYNKAKAGKRGTEKSVFRAFTCVAVTPEQTSRVMGVFSESLVCSLTRKGNKSLRHYHSVGYRIFVFLDSVTDCLIWRWTNIFLEKVQLALDKRFWETNLRVGSSMCLGH
ncbi:MAG: hypothetical protein GYA46_14505 [candidate division Zixibacteria bacterium]|nr:hypothetical protein [candidate division Zixibacteria bacterium]